MNKDKEKKSYSRISVSILSRGGQDCIGGNGLRHLLILNTRVLSLTSIGGDRKLRFRQREA